MGKLPKFLLLYHADKHAGGLDKRKMPQWHGCHTQRGPVGCLHISKIGPLWQLTFLWKVDLNC